MTRKYDESNADEQDDTVRYGTVRYGTNPQNPTLLDPYSRCKQDYLLVAKNYANGYSNDEHVDAWIFVI